MATEDLDGGLANSPVCWETGRVEAVPNERRETPLVETLGTCVFPLGKLGGASSPADPDKTLELTDALPTVLFLLLTVILSGIPGPDGGGVAVPTPAIKFGFGSGSFDFAL